MSTEINSVDRKQNIEVDAEKRAFMKKFGKYAAVGAGMATLMTPTASTAGHYHYDNKEVEELRYCIDHPNDVVCVPPPEG